MPFAPAHCLQQQRCLYLLPGSCFRLRLVERKKMSDLACLQLPQLLLIDQSLNGPMKGCSQTLPSGLLHRIVHILSQKMLFILHHSQIDVP